MSCGGGGLGRDGLDWTGLDNHSVPVPRQGIRVFTQAGQRQKFRRVRQILMRGHQI